jgi:hypothetical protein
MAEAAGLAVGVAALFTTCLESFKIIFAAQDFAKDFEVLNTSFQQQRLRLLLWGEGVGILARRGTTARPYFQELDASHVRPTIVRSLESIQHLLAHFKVYEGRYDLKSGDMASLVNLSGQTATRHGFGEITGKNQKQKSVRAVTKWAIFDADKIKDTNERLKGLIDGLVDITNELRSLCKGAHEISTSLLSMHITGARNSGTTNGRTVLSVPSRQVLALDLHSSADTFHTAHEILTSIDTFFQADSSSIEDELRAPAEGIPYRSVLKGTIAIPAYGARSVHGSVETWVETCSSSMSTMGSTSPSSPHFERDSITPTKEIHLSTPQLFVDHFPTRKSIFIEHDDTIDGNMNLRILTPVTDEHDSSTFLSLFHLRMVDLRVREFSLRRYFRNSGREVCHSSRKYQKVVSRKSASTIFTRKTKLLSKPSRPEDRSRPQSRTSSGSKTRLGRQSSKSSHSEDNTHSQSRASSGSRTWFGRRNSKSSQVSSTSWFGRRSSRSSNASGSEYNTQKDEDSVEVTATRVATNTIRLEFSNYAQLDLKRQGKRNGKKYAFGYWGHKFEWKRKMVMSGKDKSDCRLHCFHLHRNGEKNPVVTIKPLDTEWVDTMGGWVPPCELRIVDDTFLRDEDDIHE